MQRNWSEHESYTFRVRGSSPFITTWNFGRCGICVGLKILLMRFDSSKFHKYNGGLTLMVRELFAKQSVIGKTMCRFESYHFRNIEQWVGVKRCLDVSMYVPKHPYTFVSRRYIPATRGLQCNWLTHHPCKMKLRVQVPQAPQF